MGQQNIHQAALGDGVRVFTQALLDDLEALEQMLARGMFETDTRRVGVEQEMALVGGDALPAAASTDILERIEDDRITTELALFNLEANLPPRLFEGSFLRLMEEELHDILRLVDNAGRDDAVQVLLTGILPSLKRNHLSLDHITPSPRYRQLNDALVGLGEGTFHIFIRGVDELELRTDNVMFEAANTSLQLHLQVAPEEFVAQYNLAQLISAPLLAAAANSPLLLGKRLWQETRVALFERSVDARSQAARDRGGVPRVHFGTGWVQHSVLEIFQDAVARFPVALTCDLDPPPLEQIERGVPPKLSALLLHNGTVWRWNRACYGSVDGVAHLRIENRILPAGPTVLDQVANAALFFGLMAGMKDLAKDIPQRLAFNDAKGNFIKAARQGLGAQLTWLDGRIVSARDLLLEDLLPIARQGLRSVGVPKDEIQRYLGVLEERTQSAVTGARWMIDGFCHLENETSSVEAAGIHLTRTMLQHQKSGDPVHLWPRPSIVHSPAEKALVQTVADIMSTDVFTVRPWDIIDLATHMMDWKHFRHVPVETNDGLLCGLISHRTLLQLDQRRLDQRQGPVAVGDIMDPSPPTVASKTPFDDALQRILRGTHGCVLVVDDGRLVGIATERDFLRASAAMLHPQHSEEARKAP